MTCPCEKSKKKCEGGTPEVIKLESKECPVLFHTVVVPASVGTVETVPPTVGAYRNARVYYEADQIAYLYDSDGIPQLLTVPGPSGGVNSVNGYTGDVTITASDIGAAANTIFYVNLGESGNQRHIYKNSNMTEEASVQDLLDANQKGQVILRMSTLVTPELFNDAYLQNTYVGNADYQFLFLDNRVYYEYDGTTTNDTLFYYSSSTIQLQMSAGAGINITGLTISAPNVVNGGTTAPTTSTAGIVGALYTYVDSGTPHLYMCTDVSGSTYTWTEITPGL